jgi:hypothetical protein
MDITYDQELRSGNDRNVGHGSSMGQGRLRRLASGACAVGRRESCSDAGTTSGPRRQSAPLCAAQGHTAGGKAVTIGRSDMDDDSAAPLVDWQRRQLPVPDDLG